MLMTVGLAKNPRLEAKSPIALAQEEITSQKIRITSSSSRVAKTPFFGAMYEVDWMNRD